MILISNCTAREDGQTRTPSRTPACLRAEARDLNQLHRRGRALKVSVLSQLASEGMTPRVVSMCLGRYTQPVDPKMNCTPMIGSGGCKPCLGLQLPQTPRNQLLRLSAEWGGCCKMFWETDKGATWQQLGIALNSSWIFALCYVVLHKPYSLAIWVFHVRTQDIPYPIQT
jgi:hypothetical protein